MAAAIREMTAADADQIREFNTRLAGAGVTFSFPVVSAELMQPEPGVDAPHQTAYLLTDGGAVRGGYILKDERIFAGAASFPAGNYQLPLSEGIVDRRYAIVGIQLIKDALARQPRLYCLGMGSPTRPLPRLLQRLGWSVATVPFLFRIENAGNFAREIRWLRQRRALRCLLDLSRYTGVLAAVTALARVLRRRSRAVLPADVTVSETATLPEELDQLFERVHDAFGLLCDRRAAAMRRKLPPGDPRLVRLILRRSGQLAGWIVLSVSRLHEHRQFGDLTLGCIVDGLAAPADVPLLVAAGCRRLETAHCDLLVSNQSHPLWIAALRREGFLPGPSNFVLALSPELRAQAPAAAPMHFTRGDGDGPINL
jgi:hypothetical protein